MYHIHIFVRLRNNKKCNTGAIKTFIKTDQPKKKKLSTHLVAATRRCGHMFPDLPRRSSASSPPEIERKIDPRR